MSITIELYNFSKRKNSTKVPAVSGTSVDCTLKTPCSWYQPVFLLTASGMPTWNYCKWGSWYYYVTDIVAQANELFEVRCNLDPLATYRAQILATNAFVMYDTAANSEIPDTRLSTKTVRGIHIVSGKFNAIGRETDPADCPVVMSIVGQNGLSYFAVTQSVASDILRQVQTVDIPRIFNNPTSSPTTVTEEILEALKNIGEAIGQIFASGTASRCVTGAKQIAATMGAATGLSHTIYLGNFDTGKTGIEITRRIWADTLSLSIPWTFSDWRRRAPYTELYLYCPFFGLVALPVEDLIGETVIDIEAYLDMVSGSCIFEVFGHDTNHYIGTYNSSLGGEYSIGVSGVSAATSIGAMLGATAAGAAIVATGGAAAAMAVKIGGAAIAGVIGGNTPSVTCISGGGGGASMGLRDTSYLIEVTHDTTVSPDSVSAVIGTPKMAAQAVGAVPGYVQTRAASVDADAPDYILAEINSALDGGVFIE